MFTYVSPFFLSSFFFQTNEATWSWGLDSDIFILSCLKSKLKHETRRNLRVIAKQIKIKFFDCVFATVPNTCKKNSFSRRKNLKPTQPKFKYHFYHVKLSNQPHFLLLTSSSTVCSDASFLVSFWAYESRKIAWVGTSLSTISYVSVLNQNKSVQMPMSAPYQAFETYLEEKGYMLPS